jgi:hypothetical protein
MYSIKGVVTTYHTTRYSHANNLAGGNETIPAGGCDYLGIQVVNAAGVPYSIPVEYSCNLGLESDLATIPTSTLQTSYRAISSELLDLADVTHVRCTAIQMLVTDLTPEIDAGGEGVFARTKASILSATTTPALMSSIKALPEQNIWGSYKLKHGGFVTYFPDDDDSYEPRPPGQHTSENVIIACLSFAKNTGKARVIVRSVWEYYTPKQVIDRKLNYCWTESSRQLFQLLMRQPATSENAAHLALIAAITAGAAAAVTFYNDNKQWIDPLAKTGFDYVSKRLNSSPKNKNKNKKKERNVNPQPLTKQAQGIPPPPRPKRK